MQDPPSEVTRLLRAWSEGDADALDRLMPLVESELRTIAARSFRRERRDHTLQPTAVVSELYLKLTSKEQVHWQNRKHFLGGAAQMMRRILVDHARIQKAQKRANGQKPFVLDELRDEAAGGTVDLLVLEEALRDLEKIAPRQAKVVELRYFAGLTYDEISEVLEVTARTVKRDWSAARIWLFEQMKG